MRFKPAPSRMEARTGPETYRSTQRNLRTAQRSTLDRWLSSRPTSITNELTPTSRECQLLLERCLAKRSLDVGLIQAICQQARLEATSKAMTCT